MVLNKEYVFAMPDGHMMQSPLTDPLSYLEQVAIGQEVVGWNDLPLRNEFPKVATDLTRNACLLTYNQMAMLYMILAQRNEKAPRKKPSG
jgi:hypothetical protein